MYRSPPIFGQDVFGPLKRKSETVLGERMTTFSSKSTLSKGEFVNLLFPVSNEGMTESNLKSGWHMAFR